MSREYIRRLRTELRHPPRSHGEPVRDRKIGPIELFYDLVIVVLVAQAAHQLAAHLAARALCEFGVIFTMVWIIWFNGTLMHELHGREDVRSRNIFLGQILLLVPLGAYISEAGGSHRRAFAVNAALVFLFIALLWWRASRRDTPDFRPATRLYLGTTLLYAVTLFGSALSSSDARLVVWPYWPRSLYFAWLRHLLWHRVVSTSQR